jgi:hypothetical protein
MEERAYCGLSKGAEDLEAGEGDEMKLHVES